MAVGGERRLQSGRRARPDLAQHLNRPKCRLVSQGNDISWGRGSSRTCRFTWQLVTSADINRDGAPDLIWRNSATGQNVVWYLGRTTYVG